VQRGRIYACSAGIRLCCGYTPYTTCTVGTIAIVGVLGALVALGKTGVSGRIGTTVQQGNATMQAAARLDGQTPDYAP